MPKKLFIFAFVDVVSGYDLTKDMFMDTAEQVRGLIKVSWSMIPIFM
jgi:hypothetical protein